MWYVIKRQAKFVMELNPILFAMCKSVLEKIVIFKQHESFRQTHLSWRQKRELGRTISIRSLKNIYYNRKRWSILNIYFGTEQSLLREVLLWITCLLHHNLCLFWTNIYYNLPCESYKTVSHLKPTLFVG